MLDLSSVVLATLPEASRDKLERHISDRDAAFAAYCQASDREQEARAELGLTESFANSRLKAHPGIEITYPGQTPPNPTVSTQERLSAPVGAAKRALQIASAARERAAEQHIKYSFLENIADWLRRTATLGGSFREVRIDPALVKVKGNIALEIDKVRARISELEDKFAAVEVAPAPAEYLKARAFAEIESIAAAGEPTIYANTRGTSPINLAQKFVLSGHVVRGRETEVSIRGKAGSDFFVWLMRDELREKIGKMIDALPQTDVMTDAEREQAFASLAAARLEQERIEEYLVEMAEADGRIIGRRSDVDPRAYLGIEA